LRIRIHFGRLDPDPNWEYGSGSRRAKMNHKSEKIQVLNSLDGLYGSLGRSKLQFLIPKIFFFSCNFFPIFGHQNPGFGSGSALTKNAGSGSALKPMRIPNTGSLYFTLTVLPKS
jgi:hypothetical protein